MSSIKPFKIDIPDEKIQRLKQKLALTDFPDEVPDEDPWLRGAPLADVKRLAKYWENHYDWRKAEAKLNQLPQFTAQVEVEGFKTYNVHFIHQTSSVKNAIPLLFSHGWPGNILEVTKILPELVKGGKDFPAFHVVAPSLVDFGFSEGAKQGGFRIDQHAEVCHKIMVQLGYKEYVAQGGDWGYVICRTMAMKYPESCKAYHVNMAIPAEPNEKDHPEAYAKAQSTPLTAFEKAGLERTAWFRRVGQGYSAEHGTRPQTIGYNLTDSPVGLLAWIYEKLHDWTDNYQWTDDEILTWISIYYFSTAGPAASVRIYYEDRNQANDERNSAESGSASSFRSLQRYVDVKLGVARFPKELVLTPKSWLATLGPVVHVSESETGGHFAAWERPDVIVNDLREMLGRKGGAFGCVAGKDGYEDERSKL